MKVQRILVGEYWNLGSLEGSLEAINLHGKPSFTIWERVSRAPVRCYFPEKAEWKDRVKSLLEKRVLVVGKVQYCRNGVPRSITQIEDVSDATPKLGLAEAHFGCVPDPEAALDPTEFLRRARAGGATTGRGGGA